ncbi:MAG TPA: sugar ABC transporter permease [Gemmatimonadales bacterium]|nr:sugar ABC transporter permease [Gemmatimonadales bacterium]
MSWRGWAAAATTAAVVAAAVTLGVARWAESRYERAFAFRMAATTAAYLAAVTPPPPAPPPPRRARPTRRARPARPAGPPQQPPPPARGSAEYYLPQMLTLARALRTLPGWTSEVEVYYGTAPLADATAPPLAPDDLERLAREGGRWRNGVALVALRDRGGREVVGAVAVRPRSVPRGPLPGGMGFALPAALVAVGGAAAIAFRQRSLRRGGYVAAALLLAVAAYADVRSAARRSTDRWLTDTRRLLQEAATRLPPPRSRVAIEDLTGLVRDAELLPGEPGESAPRRVDVDGKRRAVVSVLIGPGRWLELRTVAAEAYTTGWLFVLLACALLGPVAILGLRWAERTPRRQRRETTIAWGFLAPAGLHLAVFSLAPVLFAIYLSVHRWGRGSVEPVRPFVGLTNFAAALRDPLTWIALRNTALYSLYVPVSVALALAVAVALRAWCRGWGLGLLRTAFLLPYVLSVVAVGLVWQRIYQSGSLGLGTTDWLSSPTTALLALMLLSLWAHVGGQMVVFLAGLQRIPQAYLDAARIDGASAWQRFWRITFPLLRPVTLFVLATGIISAFQVFTYVYVLTRGGPLPDHSTEVLVHRVYQTAWGSQEFGAAGALSLLFFLLLLVLTVTQVRLLGKQVEHA